MQNNYYAGDIFQSTPSAWRETKRAERLLAGLIFQSTPSAWRETDSSRRNFSESWHFNPLPPHGGRHKCAIIYTEVREFQSTPSAWRETDVLYRVRVPETFQSTPSAWRETRFSSVFLDGKGISIHSLRMEGDAVLFAMPPQIFISIHSLRMEGDVGNGRALHTLDNFNPLPPHGGRPHHLFAFRRSARNFNPLPPHGGRHTIPGTMTSIFYFNPLPPHGGRPYTYMRTRKATPFQSTPSAWRETAKLHRKAFFISPILVQSCKKGCKRLHSAPEKMVFFEKREKNLVRNLQHLSVRL